METCECALESVNMLRQANTLSAVCESTMGHTSAAMREANPLLAMRICYERGESSMDHTIPYERGEYAMKGANVLWDTRTLSDLLCHHESYICSSISGWMLLVFHSYLHQLGRHMLGTLIKTRERSVISVTLHSVFPCHISCRWSVGDLAVVSLWWPSPLWDTPPPQSPSQTPLSPSASLLFWVTAPARFNGHLAIPFLENGLECCNDCTRVYLGHCIVVSIFGYNKWYVGGSGDLVGFYPLPPLQSQPHLDFGRLCRDFTLSTQSQFSFSFRSGIWQHAVHACCQVRTVALTARWYLSYVVCRSVLKNLRALQVSCTFSNRSCHCPTCLW